MTYTNNPRTWEMEAVGSRVQDDPWPHRSSKSDWALGDPISKEKEEKNNNKKEYLLVPLTGLCLQLAGALVPSVRRLGLIIIRNLLDLAANAFYPLSNLTCIDKHLFLLIFLFVCLYGTYMYYGTRGGQNNLLESVFLLYPGE